MMLYGAQKEGESVMLSAYSSVKVLAKEKPGWLDVVRACYEVSGDADEFAGAWVVKHLGRWIPSLRTVAQYGIVEKVDTSKGGRRAYYRMPDREGVGRALKELEVIGE